AALAFFTIIQEATSQRRQTFNDLKDSVSAIKAFRDVWTEYAGAEIKLHKARGRGANLQVHLELPVNMSDAVQAIMETYAGFDPEKVSDQERQRVVKSATDAIRYAARGYCDAKQYK